jgi:hypothetical protein
LLEKSLAIGGNLHTVVFSSVPIFMMKDEIRVYKLLKSYFEKSSTSRIVSHYNVSLDECP